MFSLPNYNIFSYVTQKRALTENCKSWKGQIISVESVAEQKRSPLNSMKIQASLSLCYSDTLNIRQTYVYKQCGPRSKGAVWSGSTLFDIQPGYWVHTTYHYEIEDEKDFPKSSPFALWPSSMINSQWLKLPISQTSFHSPKGIWAL